MNYNYWYSDTVEAEIKIQKWIWRRKRNSQDIVSKDKAAANLKTIRNVF